MMAQRTPQYNMHYREVLESFDLKLYDQPLTYASAFQGSKVVPWRQPRVYFGFGQVTLEGHDCVITDDGEWPTVPKTDEHKAGFPVRLSRQLPAGSPTSHRNALEVIEGFADARAKVRWRAYGLPVLREGCFQLFADSLDDLYSAK